MSDKDLLYQMLEREISNLLNIAAPQFRMFSGSVSKYVIQLVDPYVDAFLSPDDNTLNSKAVGAYLKQETNEKIEKFLKDFEANQGN
jgi:ABC-type transporter MlaC component